jgi:hypothetical protein
MPAQGYISIFDMPAQARTNCSFVRRLLDAIMESRRRTAKEFLAEYNRAHKDDLRAQHYLATEPRSHPSHHPRS